eukprot:1152170-Pelagomonas_calceolata.AAC.8
MARLLLGHSSAQCSRLPSSEAPAAPSPLDTPSTASRLGFSPASPVLPVAMARVVLAVAVRAGPYPSCAWAS